MNKKVVDLLSYKIEKTLRSNGFRVMTDDNSNVKLLIKLKTDSGADDE